MFSKCDEEVDGMSDFAGRVGRSVNIRYFDQRKILLRLSQLRPGFW